MHFFIKYMKLFGYCCMFISEEEDFEKSNFFLYMKLYIKNINPAS